MNGIKSLIEHWQQLDLTFSPYIHPADRAHLNSAEKFDFTALPYPYVGDIRSADIWVLMLNSNIGPDDARQEREEYFAQCQRVNIRQNISEQSYPLFSLDPKLRHTGTYLYYNERNGLAKLIREFAFRSRVTEGEARKELARRLAVIQLFPYRSIDGVKKGLSNDAIPSVRLVRAAVREAMGSKLIVVPRSAEKWGFRYEMREQNLFTFRADQARSASLMPGGACGGGDVILERLGAP